MIHRRIKILLIERLARSQTASRGQQRAAGVIGQGKFRARKEQTGKKDRLEPPAHRRRQACEKIRQAQACPRIAQHGETAKVQRPIQSGGIGRNQRLALEAAGDEQAGGRRQLGDVAHRAGARSVGRPDGCPDQPGFIDLAVLGAGLDDFDKHWRLNNGTMLVVCNGNILASAHYYWLHFDALCLKTNQLRKFSRKLG